MRKILMGLAVAVVVGMLATVQADISGRCFICTGPAPDGWYTCWNPCRKTIE